MCRANLIQAILGLLVAAFCTMEVRGQLYREIPGRREFTGEMLIRPVQIQGWMERGLTREQAEQRYQQVSDWLIEFLEQRLINYNSFYDRYDVRLDANAGLSIDIDSAITLGTATAGSNGAALLEDIPVPAGWSGTTKYLQCVEIANCRKSNLVTYTFP